MRNKILVVIIMFLLPISIICFYKEEKSNEIIVYLNYKDKDLKLSLNEYLIGVLGAEMPASFNMEALKAQAVVSRTYALYNMNKNIINTNINDQAYLNNDELKEKWNDDYDKYYNKIKDAIYDTNDMVITYNNRLIKSYYYAISNGLTEDAKEVFNEEPYLKIVDSSFDEETKHFLKTVNIDKDEFCYKLKITCDNLRIKDIQKDDSNRIKSININDRLFSGIDIRNILNLRSTDFTIVQDDNEIIITTKGYGHGVGMSQYGANYLANNNYTFDEIIKYYYKDVEIKKGYN